MLGFAPLASAPLADDGVDKKTGTFINFWTGATWTLAPLKRWSGSEWLPAQLQRWTGTGWLDV